MTNYNNYRPVSLLPVFGKTLKKLIFKSLLEYLDEQKLFSKHQYAFRPNDARTNRLLPLVHDLYTPFNADPFSGSSTFVSIYVKIF